VYLVGEARNARDIGIIDFKTATDRLGQDIGSEALIIDGDVTIAIVIPNKSETKRDKIDSK
jgi:hypothetical protein